MPTAPIALTHTDADPFAQNGELVLIPCVAQASSEEKGDGDDVDSSKSAALIESSPALQSLAKQLHASGTPVDLAALLDDESFSGQHGQVCYLPASAAGRVLLVGVGKASVTVHRFETCIVKAMGRVKLKEIALVSAVLPGLDCGAFSAAVALAGAAHQFCYRSREAHANDKGGPEIKELRLHLSEDAVGQLSDADCAEVTAMCAGRSLCMDLVNTPSNTKRTATLAEQARDLEKLGLEVEIVEDVAWIEKEMPCFYTVARGSVRSDPPKWIRVRYSPTGGAKRRIALVGKAVIFDTGGYQIKPGQFMNTMKADMAGSAAVFGAMQAIATLKPADLAIEAFFATTPNMINGDAMLPDSIVDTTCGKRVEIRHTDAEGRLTLIDAVTMAERSEPEAIGTVATLTGAASMAVGMGMALLSRPEHEQWRDAMLTAAHASGDRVQTLDIMDEDFDDIKSKLDSADIRNTMKSKGRGAQTAAAFVLNGASPEMPLVHLDIAGGDMSDDEKATGIAAKCLVNFLLRQMPAK